VPAPSAGPAFTSRTTGRRASGIDTSGHGTERSFGGINTATRVEDLDIVNGRGLLEGRGDQVANGEDGLLAVAAADQPNSGDSVVDRQVGESGGTPSSSPRFTNVRTRQSQPAW
jgi:hypothetical protein